MNDNDRELLEKDGWTIECESPFEIRHEDGSFGSGQAAQCVLASLQYEAQEGDSGELLAEDLGKLLRDNFRVEKANEADSGNTWVEKLIFKFGEETITEVIVKTHYQ